jgi:hypothetical protein
VVGHWSLPMVSVILVVAVYLGVSVHAVSENVSVLKTSVTTEIEPEAHSIDMDSIKFLLVVGISASLVVL